MIKQNRLDKFGARSAYLAREWLVAIQTPADGAQPVIDALSENIPMVQGCYDQCLYVTGAGRQRFHAREGVRAGFKDTVQSTSAVEITFSIPQDPELLDRVFETVFAVHRNEEPTIRILETWGSRSDSLHDRDNPHHYWNRADASPNRARAVVNVYAHSA